MKAGAGGGVTASLPLAFAWELLAARLSTPLGDTSQGLTHSGVQSLRTQLAVAHGVQAQTVLTKVLPQPAWEQCQRRGGDSLVKGEKHPPGASLETVLVQTLPPRPSSATNIKMSRCCNSE